MALQFSIPKVKNNSKKSNQLLAVVSGGGCYWLNYVPLQIHTFKS